MIETVKRKTNSKGFSLAEILVVIAIMGILAGVSFVAVSRYIRNLQALEMDNTAKEIFIAAQNHLSASFASGEYERKYQEYKDTDLSANYGAKLDTKPGYLDGVDFVNEDSVYRYVISNGSGKEGGTKALILSYMLPGYAIDKEIEEEGNYLIVYEVNSASVLAVFYSGKAHTFFGGSHIHQFTADEAYESGNAYLKDAVNDRSKRVHYRKETEDSIIGCYTAAEKDNITSVTFKPLKVDIDNGSKLKVTIENPNYKTYNTSTDQQTILLKVKGLTSENQQIMYLKTLGTVSGAAVKTRYSNANRPSVSDDNVSYPEWGHETVLKSEYFTFTLDDITSKNGHFYNSFPYMIPGEQLEIEAEIIDDSVLAAPESTKAEVNSLFQSLNGSRAEIRNIRHLENLDPDISNLSLKRKCLYDELKGKISVTEAFQSGDITYSGNGSFVFDIRKDISDNAGRTLKIYKYDGSVLGAGYYGVSNEDLVSYDGCSHSIKNIYSSTGKNGDTGLFSYVSLNDGTKTLNIKNLTIENSDFVKSTDAGNAGGFIAHAVSKAKLTNCYLRMNSHKIGSLGDGCDAGGFVGKSDNLLEIVECDITGQDKVSSQYSGSAIEIISNGGNAGGFVGQNTGNLMRVNNCNILGKAANISAKSGSAGGFAGKITGVFRTEHVHFTGADNKISASGDAGGIGGCSNEAELSASDISDDTFTVEGNENAGGLLGSTSGKAKLLSCYVLGEKIKTEGKGESSNAGGIIGKASGGLDIKKTYCTSYVFAGSNAGGFIGLVASGADNDIDGSYASGHTRGASYRNGTEKKVSAYNFNVNSGLNAGGFIGNAEVAVNVTNSYATASVYASYAGGFIGKSNGIRISNTYCTGLIDSVTGGIKGGFVGSGTASGKDGNNDNYYLKGVGFNESIAAAGTGTVTNIFETSGDEILRTADKVAYPWDAELGNTYAYKTIRQLSGAESDFDDYRGDWALAKPNNLKLFISNEEKLLAVLSLPLNSLNSDTVASFLMEGMTSDRKAYMQINLGMLNNGINDVETIPEETALSNLSGEHDGSEIFYIKSVRYNKVIYGDMAYFEIYLDDVTEPGLSFASQFYDGFVNGEDIRISIRQGFVDWNTLRSDAITELSKPVGKRLPMAGITNSLFAAGSGYIQNEKYEYSHYSDINPAEAIAVVPASASEYSKTALIMNFRHLQNLDTTVSNIDSDYTKVKLLKDLYWKASDDSVSSAGSANRAFLDAIKTESGKSSVSIYPFREAGDESDPEALTVENAFYGIYNPNILDFDGNNKSINNIFIYNKNPISTDPEKNASAGLFRLIRTSPGETKKIHNLTLIEPVVVSENSNAGGLIGETDRGTGENGGTMDIDYVYVYGKNALVRTLSSDTSNNGPHAGGLIGLALYGSFYIDNSGASAYVYADTARCAGGFIGSFQPKKKSAISDCFSGGHVDPDNKAYKEEKAVNPVSSDITSITAIVSPGGYNVSGWIASGGFIGYIGTQFNDQTLIQRCFTTSSVHCEPHQGQLDNNGGAAGGFIGRTNNQYQKYLNCYSEGKVYSGAELLGAFVGHNFNNKNLSEEKRPKFEKAYVLRGSDFNDDPNLKPVNFGSSTSYDIDGITFVDHDSADISNSHPESVKVITFGMNTEEFPYRDTSQNGLGDTVFYGDWMVPEKLSPVSVDNGNRLKVSVYLKENETYSTELVGTTVYNVTYLRLEGELSKAKEYYKVLYNDDAVILQAIQVGDGWQNYFNVNTGRAVYVKRGGKKFLDFYVDNISGNRTNYKGTMQSFWTEPTAGEYFTVYVSPTFAGIKTSTDISVTANSLFQKTEKNADGTYTAYISNSRHLMNLNPAISGLGIRITKAIQTDDIYWEDDGTYGTSLYNAETQPYLTELPAASMYELYKDYKLSSAGKMLSIYNPDITEYDGQIRTMHNFNLDTNYINGGVNAGLFAKTTTALTVKNLFFSNTTVGNSDLQTGTLASGIIVGNPGAKLTVENVIIYGTTTVLSRMESGGVVGYTSSDLTMKNISIDGRIDVYGYVEAGGALGYMDKGSLNINCVGVFAHSGRISNGTLNAYNGDLGGLIGKVAGVHMDIKNSFATAYLSGSGIGVGGFIGNISDHTCTGNISNCYAGGHTSGGTVVDRTDDMEIAGRWNIIGNYCSSIGGFVGVVKSSSANPVTIENCFSTNSMTSLGPGLNAGQDYIGGFAGICSDSSVINNCYTVGYVRPWTSVWQHHGAFAGRIEGSASVTNAYYLDRYGGYNNMHELAEAASSGTISIVEDGENGCIHIWGYTDNVDKTGEGHTFHVDSLHPIADYPYKNWTDSNGYIEDSDTKLMLFYGDW